MRCVNCGDPAAQVVVVPAHDQSGHGARSKPPPGPARRASPARRTKDEAALDAKRRRALSRPQRRALTKLAGRRPYGLRRPYWPMGCGATHSTGDPMGRGHPMGCGAAARSWAVELACAGASTAPWVAVAPISRGDPVGRGAPTSCGDALGCGDPMRCCGATTAGGSVGCDLGVNSTSGRGRSGGAVGARVLLNSPLHGLSTL